jgi:AmpE protein
MLITIVAIFICIAIQRYGNIGGWFNVTWFETYLHRLRPWLLKLNSLWGILLIIVPVLLVLGMLNILFVRRLFELFNLILAVIILFFSMDARDPKKQLGNYFTNLDNHDLKNAANIAFEFTGEAITTEIKPELTRSVTKAIFIKEFEKVFAVLFWFIVSGFYGASVYFLITLLHKVALKIDINFSKIAKLATQIQNILDWIPARLLAFTFALAGHFTKGCNYFCNNWRGLSNTNNFIMEAGLASLDNESDPIKNSSEKENFAALDLINRALMIWIIATILFIVGRWL